MRLGNVPFPSLFSWKYIRELCPQKKKDLKEPTELILKCFLPFTQVTNKNNNSTEVKSCRMQKSICFAVLLPYCHSMCEKMPSPAVQCFSCFKRRQYNRFLIWMLNFPPWFFGLIGRCRVGFLSLSKDSRWRRQKSCFINHTAATLLPSGDFVDSVLLLLPYPVDRPG